MACSVDERPSLACVPRAIPAHERANHFALAKQLLNEAALERADLPAGYGFRFAADGLQQIFRFVVNERQCCPFVHFTIELSPDSGPIWLRMTGPEGTREVLEAELDLPGACGCAG